MKRPYPKNTDEWESRERETMDNIPRKHRKIRKQRTGNLHTAQTNEKAKNRKLTHCRDK